ncbi:hypothetical protein OFN30_34235, partial [Escherichia coli]|nr:hypothetical protein [Escherichia coli]
TGRNFAAGMSGGVAYVWDVDGLFAQRVNDGGGSILLEEVTDPEDLATLRDLIGRHYFYTDSGRARAALENWGEIKRHFV